MKILIKIFTVGAIFFSPYISSASDETENPFHQLPNELILHVLKYLPFEEITQHAQLICKEWQLCIQERLNDAKLLKEFTNTILNDEPLENLQSDNPSLNAHFTYALSCLNQLQDAKRQFIPQDFSLKSKFILDPNELVISLVKDGFISSREEISRYEDTWEELKRESPGSPSKFGLFVTLAFYHKELQQTKKLIQEYDLKTEKHDYFDMDSSDMQILNNQIAYKQWLTNFNQTGDFMLYSHQIIKKGILYFN